MSSILSRQLLLPWLTLIAILATFTVNVWSNLSPLNGKTIGEISNQLFADVLITPANYAFAIWGVIYLGLLGFGVYQLLAPQRQDTRLNSVRLWLIVACVAQAIWVVLFLMQYFWLSVVAMLGILLPLIAAYAQLKPPFWQSPSQQSPSQQSPSQQSQSQLSQPRLSKTDQWLVQVPFGIYLGWISVATIVNVAIALYSQGWQGGGISPQIWTVVMMVVAAAVSAVLVLQRRAIAYPLVTIWALIAIAVRQSNSIEIATTAVGLAIGLSVLLLVRRLQSQQPLIQSNR